MKQRDADQDVIRAHIERVVEAAPPLSQEQLGRLASLLRGGANVA